MHSQYHDGEGWTGRLELPAETLIPSLLTLRGLADDSSTVMHWVADSGRTCTAFGRNFHVQTKSLADDVTVYLGR